MPGPGDRSPRARPGRAPRWLGAPPARPAGRLRRRSRSRGRADLVRGRVPIERGTATQTEIVALLDATRLIAELADGGTSADRIRDATLSRITLGWPGQVVPPVEPDPLVSSSGLAVDLWLKTIDRRGIARHLVLGPHPEAARFTSIPLFE